MHVYAKCVYLVPTVAKVGHHMPWNWKLHGYREPNLAPLEQQVLSRTEPSLLPVCF